MLESATPLTAEYTVVYAWFEASAHMNGAIKTVYLASGGEAAAVVAQNGLIDS